jgi:predicted RNA-binding protein with EMAP domain
MYNLLLLLLLITIIIYSLCKKRENFKPLGYNVTDKKSWDDKKIDAIKKEIINTLQIVKEQNINPDKFVKFFEDSMPKRKIELELNNIIVDDKDVFHTNFYYDYFFNIDGIRYLITILYNFDKTQVLQIIYKDLDKPLMYYIAPTDYLEFDEIR